MLKDIAALVAELTLEEKAALCSGISSWETTPVKRKDIPSVFMADGPHGVRREQKQTSFGNVFMPAMPATCFPPAVTLASSWDTDLVREVGVALGEEALDHKVQILLGPGVNIKRSPLCGRNFEYFSEDPYLAGELAVAYIDGVQSTGVGTSLKHYAVNSQEFRRMTSSSELDERAMREIYLPAFETAVKRAHPYTVMCSYNRVNGTYAAENKHLLDDILRKEWGFDGIVVSDWGAVADRVEGIRAGMNLQMPSADGITDEWIVEAVKKGELDEKRLDEIVSELLSVVFKCAENAKAKEGYKADFAAHRKLARKAAAHGSVLLKNDGGILPLDKNADIAVIGALAKNLRTQGSGSSRLNPIKETSFTDYLDEIGKKYVYAEGYDCITDDTDDAKICAAGEAVKGKDAVLLFIGLTDAFESEAFDRKHLSVPESHLKVLEEVARYNSNVIVVLTGGSPSTMPYLDKVKAVLNVYLTGEAGGEATYDVLFGDVNPSGKLAETFPLALSDNPMHEFYEKENAEYRESIYVGYRYYDSAHKEVLFPFGYGLSYTEFEYSDLKIGAEKIDENDSLKVSFSIKNVGKVKGAEVAQLYVKDTESTLFVAEKALKGFAKVELEPGESKSVTLTLDRRSFAYYNVLAKDWRVEAGEFEILVGASSRDIRLEGKVNVSAEECVVPDYRVSAPAYYDVASVERYPEKDFEVLLGRKAEKFVQPKRGEYTMLTCMGQLNHGVMARLVKYLGHKYSVALLPKDTPYSQIKMVRAGALDMPIRNTYAMSSGGVNYTMSSGLLDLVNGRFFRGVFRLIKGYFTKTVHKKDVYGG